MHEGARDKERKSERELWGDSGAQAPAPASPAAQPIQTGGPKAVLRSKV